MDSDAGDCMDDDLKVSSTQCMQIHNYDGHSNSDDSSSSSSSRVSNDLLSKRSWIDPQSNRQSSVLPLILESCSSIDLATVKSLSYILSPGNNHLLDSSILSAHDSHNRATNASSSSSSSHATQQTSFTSSMEELQSHNPEVKSDLWVMNHYPTKNYGFITDDSSRFLRMNIPESQTASVQSPLSHYSLDNDHSMINDIKDDSNNHTHHHPPPHHPFKLDVRLST